MLIECDQQVMELGDQFLIARHRIAIASQTVN
ncbi:hypothetical protein CY0110_15627 [Crocosphaera chwakensis CCY0110]|uniref:Uncharacterized protein n=1 Tax=Crocosphaera chwakensis CCY0110 TaxID=391612 RepID=A3IHF7_9CHRO|nr:hypothetical protein CY0110_15627 [Crocosphaera chwakensis CCY0110]